MIVEIISFLAVFAAMLACIHAASQDISEMKIDNIFSLVIAISFLLYFVPKSDIMTLLYHLETGFAVFCVTFLFYVMKLFGAGDVKFLSALALWAGPSHIFTLLMTVVFVGGIYATWLLMRRYLSRGVTATQAMKTRMPYGVAIAAGGLYVLQVTA